MIQTFFLREENQMKTRYLLRVSLMLSVFYLMTVNVSGVWRYGTVASDVWHSVSNVIDVDNLDRTHIVYFDSYRNQVRYIWLAPEGWRYETIADATSDRLDMRLDGGNNPHVIWAEASTLRYSYRDSQWIWIFWTANGHYRYWKFLPYDRIR